jgi:Flp pilus assembly protein TadG
MDALNDRNARRGIATLEVAIVLPLLLILIAAVIEYGWVLLKVQQITSATREGARVAALPDSTNADVQAAVLAAMTVADLSGSGFTLTINPGDITVLGSGETVTVSLSVPYSNIELGMPLVPTPGTLSSSLTMAKEGP